MNSKSYQNLLKVIFLISMFISACESASPPTTVPVIPNTGPATPTEPPPAATPTATPAPPTPTQSPQASANEPVGAYRVKLSANNPIGVSSGYYRLTLSEDGSYKIDWSPQEAQDGMVGVNGSYTLDGGQIVFTDEEGFAACTTDQGVTGAYEWSLSSSGLSLTPIDDTCQARVYIFSSKSLPRDR